MIALALPAAANEGGFVPPTLEDMHLPEILPWAAEYGTGFGKQMLLVLLSVALIAWFFLAASRRGQLVPGKLQHLGEMSYNFVRNSVGKDIIGERDYRPYVPLLFSLFFFILVNNLFGSIPLLQIPTPSHVGTAYALAGIVYITWIVLGLKKHGIGYFKLAVVPAGVPKAILPLIVIIEIISTFLVRPVTHSLRLFATMLAGHLIIMLAAAGSEFLIMDADFWFKPLGILTIAGGVGMYMFEILIQVLQAYVFVLLTAIYIQGSLAEEH
ncbi:F0F1 ATP synthase subunit A [Arthrobacter crystallopoietes]|uniref:ATP synthase subunit a n=1 Tax=Crystallibacter crystallopoietes TaxID=37928 RepID=A0A1H1FMG7_9MICC|nr:F0F1 ATP synthase subunit A [Arthrobacter crystallopoietes]AUI53013.1 ATP synthase F0 subunit A [Arthrobacter crystallopoietes]SDR02101.1 ATP synthase F0 subcomplex A subunit [Arthrobacter crystallopoietes]